MNAIDRLLTNGGRILEFLKDFTIGTSKDVSITYINADGTESISTFKNIAKMVAELESWKSSFRNNPYFTGIFQLDSLNSCREKVYVGSVRINGSDQYFNTGFDIGILYVGYSILAQIEYERDDGDAQDNYSVCASGYYVGAERVGTVIIGDGSINYKVDADGFIWVRKATATASSYASLRYKFSVITR